MCPALMGRTNGGGLVHTQVIVKGRFEGGGLVGGAEATGGTGDVRVTTSSIGDVVNSFGMNRRQT